MGGAAESHNCRRGMTKHQTCKVSCPASHEAVGFFTCLPNSFAGSSACIRTSALLAHGVKNKLVAKVKAHMRMTLAVDQSMEVITITESFKDAIAVALGVSRDLGVSREHISRVSISEVSRRPRNLRGAPGRGLRAVSKEYEVDYEVIVPHRIAVKGVLARVASLSSGEPSEATAFFEDRVSSKGVVVQSWKVAEPPTEFSDVELVDANGGVMPKATFMTAAGVTPGPISVASASEGLQNSDGTPAWLLIISISVVVLGAILLVVMCYRRYSNENSKLTDPAAVDATAEQDLPCDASVCTLQAISIENVSVTVDSMVKEDVPCDPTTSAVRFGPTTFIGI